MKKFIIDLICAALFVAIAFGAAINYLLSNNY